MSRKIIAVDIMVGAYETLVEFHNEWCEAWVEVVEYFDGRDG